MTILTLQHTIQMSLIMFVYDIVNFQLQKQRIPPLPPIFGTRNKWVLRGGNEQGNIRLQNKHDSVFLFACTTTTISFLCLARSQTPQLFAQTVDFLQILRRFAATKRLLPQISYTNLITPIKLRSSAPHPHPLHITPTLCTSHPPSAHHTHPLHITPTLLVPSLLLYRPSHPPPPL
ncbi:hypothetical protein AYI69_g10445 [Smittium culicis]|uniref:Uncharacterized protein n=1 Tax=Smittium culicis TaxID=133412 RepID=A0A1R1X5L8_9FUNG|nr:hypothetical protein AYI69_g10445 [Smittium culicis]